MNIMLFSRIIAKSGVGMHIKLLAGELARRGNNVVVCSTTNELNIGDDDGVKFVLLKHLGFRPVKLFRAIRTISSIISENKVEIVHCHHRKAALCMKFYNFFHRHIPVIYTLHLFPVPSSFFHRMATYTGNKAVGVSNECSDFLVKKLHVPAKNVLTVFNGIDASKFEPLSENEKSELKAKWNIPDGVIVFCVLARISEEKNQKIVVDAVKRMSPAMREKCRVLFTGNTKNSFRTVNGGGCDSLFFTIQEAKLEKYFIFTGWVNSRDVLGISDMLLLPSKKEGFPLSVIEAHFMKIPVLRTRTSGFDERFAMPLDMNSSADLAMKMTDFIENRTVTVSVEDAYSFAIENFTVAVMTDKLLALYKEARS